jgi:hypothetical protein
VDSAAPDGLGFAGFVGGAAHGFVDPSSYIPVLGPEKLLATSIASQIVRTAAREAGANMVFTTVSEPLVRRDAEQLGIERGFGDFLFDLGASGVAGAAIGGGFAGAVHVPRAAGNALFPGLVRRYDAASFGKALTREIERTDIPDGPLKGRDATLARVFGDTVPRDERTPDEQAAIDAVTRDAEVKATSPFVPGPLGDDEHAKWLDLAMRSLHDDRPAPRTVKPIAREQVAGPEDVSGARMPERELLKAKIGAVEGAAKNPASGAEFKYQFVPQTWVSLFKRRYPNDTRSFGEIAALRSNPQLREVLMNDLISENAAALRHAGFEESAGNLYLAHVLGHDRAMTVLRALPDARLGDLLPHDYFKGNPFRPSDTAASLVHWAYGKMGDSGLPAHPIQPFADGGGAPGAEAIRAGEGDPQVEPQHYRAQRCRGAVRRRRNDRSASASPELFDNARGACGGAASLRA